MPKLGMTMTEGTLVRWVIAEGDAVEKGQVIAEVETDKLVNELESPGAGTLAGIGVAEGELVPVGHTMAWILQEGESAQQITATQD
jgi:pyruvate/2-oxoglutarate dehydrogenase complex dihydrolipoamide acyltransferase (E2) component